MKIDVLDKGHVQYVEHMGTDLSVVNAARVSFDKESEWEYDTKHGTNVLGDYYEVSNQRLSDRDTKLINYLARHQHWTPFGQCNLQLRIKMPIFVARQMMRSNIGIVWNEVSRRYVDSEPEFYEPDVWRGRPDGSIKQGSGAELSTTTQSVIDQNHGVFNQHSLDLYNDMLLDGVCPEQARMVLPQSTYTEVVGNFTLAALARVCALREDSHAQWEIQEFARAMGKIAKEYFPVSWEALTGGKG